MSPLIHRYLRVQLVIIALTLIIPGGFLAANEKAEDGKEPAAIYVEVTGTGRPMILIPGLSCGGHVWDGTVAHFKDRYECHVVTLCGFAGQPAVADPSLEKVRAGLCKYFRDKHLDRPIIVGHSLGAMMAFWLGITAPDQVGPIIAVDGVPYFPALSDRTATPQSVAPRAEALRAMFKVQTEAQFAFGIRAFLAGMITDPQDLEKVAGISTKSDPKTVAQAFYELMTVDLRSQVGTIRTPVLLIGATASAQDPEQKNFFEENYRAQVASIPKHKVIFAPKAKHFIQLDEAAFFLQEVEGFLKETEAEKNNKNLDR